MSAKREGQLVQPRTKRLFLHVGHGKTGTSFLQNVLVLSQDNLLEDHILYPTDVSRESANFGEVTSGNARHIFESLSSVDEFLSSIEERESSILLSSEFLFLHFPDILKEEGSARELFSTLRRHGFEQIDVLLFIRDPISFAVSAWLQLIKSNRGQLDLSDFLSTTTARYPSRVRRFIEICINHDLVSLTILNYSRIKENQISALSSWLGVNESRFVIPSNVKVNRSLTGGEACIIKLLNSSGAHFDGHVGKELASLLPNVPSSGVTFPLELQIDFLHSMRQDIDFVSNFTGIEHAYRDDLIEDAMDVYCFSKEQLEIISEYLINHAIPGSHFQQKTTIRHKLKSIISKRFSSKK
ncbi:hypothetical protein [Lutimaribacter saemankumensis]|uniref:hypothetical protein n=1 Tax=Lutimaribacter saemankumensis TaxID=490829 RepID=UPI001113D44D|nr:hypothetical protein [Lutimaribacter saemankumensis]